MPHSTAASHKPAGTYYRPTRQNIKDFESGTIRDIVPDKTDLSKAARAARVKELRARHFYNNFDNADTALSGVKYNPTAPNPPSGPSEYIEGHGIPRDVKGHAVNHQGLRFGNVAVFNQRHSIGVRGRANRSKASVVNHYGPYHHTQGKDLVYQQYLRDTIRLEKKFADIIQKRQHTLSGHEDIAGESFRFIQDPTLPLPR